MNDYAGFIRKSFCQKLVNLCASLPKDGVVIYIGKKNPKEETKINKFQMCKRTKEDATKFLG